MKDNGESGYVTEATLLQVCEETQDMINGLRIALNNHAEVLMLHRKILQRFVPEKHLEAFVNEYVVAREKEIEEVVAAETAPETVN